MIQRYKVTTTTIYTIAIVRIIFLIGYYFSAKEYIYEN